MRLFVIPLFLVGLLMQAPTTTLGNTNQQAAEKIANTIGEKFPDADIAVEYKGGQVWLKGEAGSQDQRKKIVEHVFQISGINVTEVADEIHVVASGAPARQQAQSVRPTASAFDMPVPMPNVAQQRGTIAAQTQPQMMAAAPQQYNPPMYGVNPGQQPVAPAPFVQASYVPYQQPMVVQQPLPQHVQYVQPQNAQQYHPSYYGQPAQAAYHPEAYGPQGPLPGQYNQPYLPDYAWPTYANYPNYSQVSYPRQYSPKAWPYIGPFYPYPQTPIGWRKVTLEHSNGWWWLDFDDGTPSGPYSGLFRQPQRYTY